MSTRGGMACLAENPRAPAYDARVHAQVRLAPDGALRFHVDSARAPRRTPRSQLFIACPLAVTGLVHLAAHGYLERITRADERTRSALDVTSRADAEAYRSLRALALLPASTARRSRRTPFGGYHAPMMIPLGPTDLRVFPLCLGGNVFGWSANEAESFAVLDAYAAAGGNFLDTADVYSAWVPGNAGGESEAILGRWMKARGNRSRMVVATKVGLAPGLEGLSKATIRAAAEASLKRLQVDHIDLYYAHRDDPKVPIAESLGAFDALVREGKVRHIAASQYGVARLAEALAISKREGLARYVGLQVDYSLVHRGEYEGELHALCDRERVACLPFYSLAKGFLTGKYRPGGAKVESVRAQGAAEFLDARGLRVLDALDAIAANHATTVAAVALAWLARQPGVATPIASARTPEQLAELLPFVGLTLTGDEVERLTGASG